MQTYKTENTFTSTITRKNKHRSLILLLNSHTKSKRLSKGDYLCSLETWQCELPLYLNYVQ